MASRICRLRPKNWWSWLWSRKSLTMAIRSCAGWWTTSSSVPSLLKTSKLTKKNLQKKSTVPWPANFAITACFFRSKRRACFRFKRREKIVLSFFKISLKTAWKISLLNFQFFASNGVPFFTPKLSHFQLNSLTPNTNLFHLYLYSMEWSSFAINWLLFYVVIYELRLRLLNETRLPNCNRNIGSSP